MSAESDMTAAIHRAIADHEFAEPERTHETDLDDDDVDEWEGEEIVRAKWCMDGARTLSECASALRVHAERMERLERDGWQLTDLVESDYGIIKQHEGRSEQ
jgi:hypothetical protein